MCKGFLIRTQKIISGMIDLITVKISTSSKIKKDNRQKELLPDKL